MTGVPTEPATGAESQDSAPVSSCAPQKRVVFDTNVLVSLYVFADSRFAFLREVVERGDWQAITNDACLAEFRRVLGYPIFALDEQTQAAALSAYLASSTLFREKPAEPLRDLPRCKDRDDQKFLELARDSRADWLVTADKALLQVSRRDRLRGLFRILTPEAALADAQPQTMM